MKFSVVTVAFNSEKTIVDTICSVASQKNVDFEHLIIDGASSDRTVEVSKLHSVSTTKIFSEPDNGIYDAMNKGFERSEGDVIGFLNADDMFADDQVLSHVAAAFENPSVEACFADLLYVSEDNRSIVRYWKSRSFEKGSFALGWCPAHPTFYIRRSALERLGSFDLTCRLAADAEFMMRYLERGGVQSIYIPRVLVRMRVGGATNKSWSNIFRQNQEIFRALKSNGIPFSPVSFLLHKSITRVNQRLNGYRLKDVR